MDIRAWCAFLRKSTQNKRVNFRMIHAQKRAGCMLDVLHWQMEFAKDFLKDRGDPWASYLRVAYSNFVVQIALSRMINRGCTGMGMLTKSSVC